MSKRIGGNNIFNRILVVCTGNICRSPCAQMILRKAFPTRVITSAGIKAARGKPMDKNLEALLASRGYSCEGHLSQRLTGEMISNSNLVLVMEETQKNFIMVRYPESSGKVLMLGKWCGGMEIQDPYRKSPEFYQFVFDQIEKSCKQWSTQLK